MTVLVCPDCGGGRFEGGHLEGCELGYNGPARTDAERQLAAKRLREAKELESRQRVGRAGR